MDEAANAEYRALMEKMAQDEKLLTEVAAILKDSAASLGILLRHPQYQDTLKVAPLTLFPNIIPHQALEEIIQIQCDINLLMHRFAHDPELLNLALGGAASVDPFIKNLFDIYQQIDVDSQWELGLIRSDYILSQCDSPTSVCYQQESTCLEQKSVSDQQESVFDQQKSTCLEQKSVSDQQKSACYQQVEINMVCVGLAGLGSKVGLAHDRVFGFLGSNFFQQKKISSENSSISRSDTLSLYGDALKSAFDVYCENFKINRKKNPVILIVVHDGFEFNIMDQRFVEFAVAGVTSIRRSFRQIAQTAVLDDEMCLFVEGREVAVVYYRTGYAPNQYKDRDWEMRLLMEKSNAIKSPSVAHQLSGFKKIQQMLSRHEILQRFFPDEKLISRIRKAFVGQWDVSEAESADKLEEALREPEKFVLKPNREGGGNNFYGQDLVEKIQQVRGTKRAQEFILMDLIRPVLQENYLIRSEISPEFVETINEIGVFGAILAKNGKIIFNKFAKEVLVRSKANGVKEGGVSSGHSCISSSLVTSL